MPEIVFEDHDHGSSRKVDSSIVPEAIAFVTLDGKRVPVARIVTLVEGGRRIIRSYDAGGKLLATTIGS